MVEPMAPGRLAGRVALVTGGGGAIGAATCRALDGAGAFVIVADVREDAARRVADELEHAEALQLDVTSSADWKDAARDVEARHGRLDVLVNGAATHVQALVEDMSDEDWDRVVRTNSDSVFFGCRAVIPLMRTQGSGSIINVVTGQFGVAYSSAYTSSKFLVHGFSQCLVLEVARYGVRVNCIAPGSIPNTGFERWYREKAELLGMPYADFLASALDSIPLHRFGVPEDIAAGALYLASDDASYVTGQLLNVDGGFSGYSIALAREET
jgi:NAD(P)-dependent dehydrogenase (short-subunit alcohol dehydrogenase family)